MARKTHKPVNLSELEFFKFSPITQTQAEAAYSYREGKNLLLSGYAGTGKTMLALALGLEALKRGDIKQVVVFRSAVASRDIGFLPGTEEEKMAAYEKSIKQTFKKLTHNDTAYQSLKTRGVVNFSSTSFERGTTYDNALIIVDEVQNLSFEEIDTIVTRCSDSSRVILSGDFRQSDIKWKSGFKRAVDVVKKLEDHFELHEFGIDDIVRGPLVKAWIIAAGEESETSLELETA